MRGLVLVVLMSLGLAAQTASPERYRYTLQCIHAGPKVIQNYYDAKTDARPETPLNLPGGGKVLSVFPDDREFELSDDQGHLYKYKDGKSLKGQRLPPGKWKVFTKHPNGIVVFLK